MRNVHFTRSKYYCYHRTCILSMSSRNIARKSRISSDKALSNSSVHPDLCVQKDDSLLGDVEVNSTALIASSLLDLLTLCPKHIGPKITQAR